MTQHVERGVHEHITLTEASQLPRDGLDVLLATVIICSVEVAVEENLQLRQMMHLLYNCLRREGINEVTCI